MIYAIVNCGKNTLQVIQKTLQSELYWIVFQFIGLLFSSWTITWFIFNHYYNQFDNWLFEWLLNPLSQQNRIFLISWLIIFLLNLFLVLLTKRLFVGSGILAIAAVIFIFISQVKITSRNIPFLPEDLWLIGEASKMTSVINNQQLIFLAQYLGIALSLTISGLILSQLLNLKRPLFKKRRQLLFTRIIIGSFALFLLAGLSKEISNSSLDNKEKNIYRSTPTAWNQTVNYFWNGPIIGFVYNLGDISLTKPADYSATRVQQITQKYAQKAEEINLQFQTIAEADIDIVTILSESLTLPLDFQKFYNFNSNPMPELTKILNTTTSGRLTTDEFGGGTANVEYEILTGLSNTATPSLTPFTHLLPKIKDFPSLARQLKKHGYQTIAMHYYHGSMYKRHLTYPHLGFEQFIDGPMLQPEDIENFASLTDDKFYDALWQKLNQNDQPKFIHGVTMQNHAPYEETPVDQPLATAIYTSDPTEHNRLNNYLKRLTLTDRATADFLHKISQRPRKTAVILFGDHLPGNIYNQVPAEERHLSHQTPFLIYTNFPVDHQQNLLISGNYLQNILLKTLNLKLTPFQMMLDELRQKYPTLNFNHLTDFQQVMNDPVYQEYQIIHYDMLSGKKYALSQNFF